MFISLQTQGFCSSIHSRQIIFLFRHTAIRPSYLQILTFAVNCQLFPAPPSTGARAQTIWVRRHAPKILKPDDLKKLPCLGEITDSHKHPNSLMICWKVVREDPLSWRIKGGSKKLQTWFIAQFCFKLDLNEALVGQFGQNLEHNIEITQIVAPRLFHEIKRRKQR